MQIVRENNLFAHISSSVKRQVAEILFQKRWPKIYMKKSSHQSWLH